ncbi:hypothetical protein LQV05_003890 [Cryptococcus neoformans]|nr:hypothetical protein C356_01443 [Cryptococcus neoformans var. grubii c45]OXB38772.1 hypothetical protein J007_01438 [Cryptococcus neoformans var. grubii]OXC63397.1 hypothetical protein C358_01442 [Cryptococcus neoformans var. grubii MW-RSA852]UOH81222.1 hypothetical protein LQV05_003890 [Cryptococcus neoformans]
MSSSPPPPLPPLKRSDYAAYSSFLYDLQAETQRDLSVRLAGQWDHPTADDEESIVLSDDSDLRESARSRSTSTVRPRLVEGSAYIPANPTLGKRRRRLESSDDRETCWPSAVDELDPLSDTTLQDAITSFATSYIREKRLILPELGKDGDNDRQIDPILPGNLISSTIVILDEILVNLAGVRPPNVQKKRKEMNALDWEGVLDVASMIPSLRPDIAAANVRLRDMYRNAGPDLLSHRMKIINDLKNSNPCPSINDLYSTVLPGKNPLLRSHLSKTEQERRALKRREKEKIRAEKAKIQEAQADEQKAKAAERAKERREKAKATRQQKAKAAKKS